MPSSPNSQTTDFSRDVLGRYICNGLDEALKSTDQAVRPDARPFSVIVIGGGTFGSVFAEHVFSKDKNQTRRVLVLEGGPYMLPEHTQDLPALGLNPPSATSIADLRAMGQDKQARAEVWGLPWHSRDALFPGLAYCLGGRSLFWGGWSPWPLDAEFRGFPADVVKDLQTTYLAQAADQVGSSETNDFIHGPLHEALRKQLFEGIGAGIVKEAVPFAELPLRLRVRMGSVMAATAGAVATPSGGSSGGPVPVPDFWKLEAPLAVQSGIERSGFFPANKFSAVPLLMEATRQAYFESQGDNVRKRLMAVPNCHVTRLVTVAGRVVEVQTNQGNVPVAPNGIVVIALGTIESTRLALLSFGGTLNYDQIGRNLIAHLRTNMSFTIHRESLTSLGAEVANLQTSALFLKGRHEFTDQNGNKDGTVGHFHLQITATGLAPSGGAADSELFQKVPDIDQVETLSKTADDRVIVVLRGIGEMEQRFGTKGVTLDPEKDEFGMNRAIVTITKTAKDEQLFTAIEQASDQALKVFSGGKPIIGAVSRNRDDLGTTHHEAGTLWMGDNPSTSVTDSGGRFHHIENAFALGPSLCPMTGSPNPMLTGVAMARRMADRLFAPYVAESGYTALFDGLSTANWRMGGQGSFVSADGALESTPGGDIGLFYCIDPTPPDFSLKLEWLRTGANDNSGVFVRFPDPNSKGYSNTAFVGVDFGFEIQIDETASPDGAPMHRTGAIYAQPNQAFSLQPAKPVGEWNEYEIRVKGQTYTVILNGAQVTQFKNTIAGRGLPSGPGQPSFIGLQSHTGRVWFRKIRITAI